MMKLGLALLAVGAAATRTQSADQFGNDCWGDYIWEECSWSYYQVDYCTDDCGWWYSPELDDDWSDDYWVTCDEFAEWWWCQDYEEPCDNEWIWEDCSWMWYRNACEGEGDTDCGWIYWDDWWQEEFWVDCDEFYSWSWCW